MSKLHGMSQLCFVARDEIFERAGPLWSHHCFVFGRGCGWIQFDVEFHFRCLRLKLLFRDGWGFPLPVFIQTDTA